MKCIWLSYILLLTLLSSCTKPNEIISLNGTDWEFAQLGSSNYQPATVPGTIQTDLLKLGSIPNPFLLNNEDSIQWVAKKNWAYKKTFSVPKKQLIKKQHLLRFEGIDTYANIFLNDSLILETNNAFRTWEIDVSTLLANENTLAVQFKSAETIEKEKAKQLKYELPEAPRVFTRKPQFQYGWDWGPTIKTVGIWRDVSLASYDLARLTHVFIKTDSITEKFAYLSTHLEMEAAKMQNFTVEIYNKTTGETFEIPVLAEAGTSKTIIPFEITDPKRWWTHNLGDPFLYEINIKLKHNNVVIDSLSKRVGVRDIQLITEKDSIGESFYFQLNGKPIYMKGANYIPQNIFLPEVTKAQSRQLIEDAVSANMNMLRVWGGGVYEADSFYDLCDEKGVLVWQDFMFACAMYPGDEDFLENIKAEAIDNVKRLRQHPSIALWCGNNENSEGWHRWGWQANKTEAQKEEIWGNYQTIFNNILPRVVDSLHPSVSYWESSPKYGRGDTRYQFEGDAHDWWVWHDGYPFEHFEEEVPRFMSEFGFQSFPGYEAIKLFTQLDTINLEHSSFATHQKHSRGFQLISQYMARNYVVPEQDADYVYVSQLLQAYGISKGIRAHRRAKPYNMGTLFWQLNDCWPVVSWSSIDGLGNWKALHYEAKRAFENVIISTAEVENQLQISVINDALTPVTGTLQLELLDFNGKLFMKDAQEVTIAQNGNQMVWAGSQPDYNQFNPARSVLKITFGNQTYLHYFVKPKDLQLSNQAITITQSENDAGVKIQLTATALQKDVFLSTDVSGHYSDNFFDLLPGEERTIQFYATKTMPSETTVNTLNRINNNDEASAPTYNLMPSN